MYIHLGRDYVLNDRDIIGIFNLETTTITPPGPGVSELRPEERRGGESFGRAAPELCSGRRGRGGHGVSFGTVACCHAAQSRKNDRVNQPTGGEYALLLR